MLVRYLAHDGRKLRRGSLEAEDLPSAESSLERLGWRVVWAEPAPSKPKRRPGKSPGLRSLSLFFRFLASAVRVGVPLGRALDAQARSAKGPWAEVLSGLLEEVSRGKPLSDAMASYPAVFPRETVELVRAGERSGRAASAFESCALSLSRRAASGRRLLTSLAYPAFVVVFALGAGGYLSLVALPRMASVFGNMGVEMPFLTKAVLFAGERLKRLAPVLAVGAGGLAASFPFLCRAGLLDVLLYRLPGFGAAARAQAVSRFCRVLSDGLSAGVPASVCLELSASVAGGRAVSSKLLRSARMVLEGESLAAAFESSGVLPPLVIEALRSGESSGSLPEVLSEIASHYEDEAEAAMKAATSLLEPAVVFGVALVVGLLAASVVLPMYTTISKVM